MDLIRLTSQCDLHLRGRRRRRHDSAAARSLSRVLIMSADSLGERIEPHDSVAVRPRSTCPPTASSIELYSTNRAVVLPSSAEGVQV